MAGIDGLTTEQNVRLEALKMAVPFCTVHHVTVSDIQFVANILVDYIVNGKDQDVVLTELKQLNADRWAGKLDAGVSVASPAQKG